MHIRKTVGITLETLEGILFSSSCHSGGWLSYVGWIVRIEFIFLIHSD